MAIHTSIDFDECEGHGICARVAPEIFKIDEDGNTEILLEEVPEALRLKLQLAERQCPVQAISVWED
ncbi:MAG: sterol 14alpha-demethylase [Chloroflexota bacterium]|jgi:ferredoxin|nr:sterol 14alpha-demethylase [Chloroflexota bacterium]